MIILVEGNEGTGKTTLINELMKIRPFIYVKYPKELKCTYELYKNLLRSKKDYIFDRSFISDMVYRCWDKDETQMTLNEVADVLSHFDTIKIIFCHNENAFDKALARGEDFITSKQIHSIIERNYEVIENLIKAYTTVSCYDYNYDYDLIEDVIDFIGKY